MIVGIQRRGVQIAERIAARIEASEGIRVPLGALDITLYRDDLQTVGPRPVVGKTTLPVALDGRRVVIVDDVLFTGRTIRAALDELADFGRPARVGLAVLIDRGDASSPSSRTSSARTSTRQPVRASMSSSRSSTGRMRSSSPAEMRRDVAARQGPARVGAAHGRPNQSRARHRGPPEGDLRAHDQKKSRPFAARRSSISFSKRPRARASRSSSPRSACRRTP